MVNMKSYQPKKSKFLKYCEDIFSSQFINRSAHYLPMVNVKSYRPKKLILFTTNLEIFLAHNLSTLMFVIYQR
jgi:hypothetical protein